MTKGRIGRAGAIAAAVLAAAVGPRGAEALSPWPMYGQNPQRTNATSIRGPRSDPQVRWKVALDADSLCQPVIGDNRDIYVTTAAGTLYAVAPNGQVEWTFSGAGAGQWTSGAAVGNDGTVYYVSGDYIHAVHPDGTERWTYYTGPGYGGTFSYPPLIGPDNRLHVDTWAGHFAINTSGTMVWKRPGQMLARSVALPNGNVIVKEPGLAFACIGSGAVVRWRTEVGVNVDGPFLGVDNTVYGVGYDGEVWALDPLTGEVLRKMDTAPVGSATAALGPDGSLYFSGDSALHKVTETAEEVVWTTMDADPVITGGRAGPPVVDGMGRLFISDGQNGNHLQAFSPDGELLWSLAADERDHHFYAPSMGLGGVLYAVTWDYGEGGGYLYAVIPEPGSALLLLPGLGAVIRRRGRKRLCAPDDRYAAAGPATPPLLAAGGVAVRRRRIA